MTLRRFVLFTVGLAIGVAFGVVVFFGDGPAAPAPDRHVDPHVPVVAGTGVDPVTSRFSGARSAN